MGTDTAADTNEVWGLGGEGPDLHGRDEMNLAEFPISALTDYVPPGQNTIRHGDGAGSLLITGSDAFGLPTAADADVVVALIQLTKRRSNFTDPTVTFTRTELLNILGWPESGRSYRRLTESLYRWSTTSLHYEGTWWDQRTRRKINAVFHILNEVVLYDRAEGPGGAQTPVPSSYFTWNKIFLESCQAGNLKRLDVRMYFALEHASSKRLYRFLDKRLHRQPDQTFDLAEIAFERVGLSRSYVGKKGGLNIGKVREKLQPAIDELEARGFLAPLSREERYQKQKDGWTVRFVRAADPVSAGSTAGEAEAAVAEVADAPKAAGDAVVEALVERGVTRSKAEALVKEHPEEMIAEKVEIFDWKLAARAKGMEKNPSGWLIKAIEDGYPAPKGFESRATRAARQAAEVEAEEADRRRREETRRRDRGRRAVDDYLARLDPARRAALEAEVLAAASETARSDYEALGSVRLRKALLLSMLRDHVAELLSREERESMLF